MRHPTRKSTLPRCVACLFSIGWGTRRIVRHTGFAKTTVLRFAKFNSLSDEFMGALKHQQENARRTKRSAERQKRIEAHKTEVAVLRAMGPHLLRRQPMDRYRADIERSRAKGRANAMRRYYRIRHTPAFKAQQFARNQIARIARQASGYAKALRSHEYLGCTYQQAAEYIAAQLPSEWSWSNYGEAWEIDHVIQLSDGSLLDQEHIRGVCHYTNLRPLAVTENRTRAKGAWRGRQDAAA